MSIADDSQPIFPPRLGEQFYHMDKSDSLSSSLYSPKNFLGDGFLHPPKIHTNRTQQRSLSAKSGRNPPVFDFSPNSSSQDILNQSSLENIAAQDMRIRRYSIDNVNAAGQPSDQRSDTSYVNLTQWTSKLSDQDISLTPSSGDAFTIPVMPNQQPPVPTAAGPIHFTTRMHKVAPYHNAFSRLSPLQPKPSNKSYSNSLGNQADQIVSCPSGEVLKSICSKENRFKRTAEALQKSGLWDIAMKTGHLIKRNQELQKELEQFKMDALNFLKSVIKNPENRDFIKSVLNSALCGGATESKKSVMTVVVSAAAAVAAVSASDPMLCSNNVNGEVCNNVSVVEKPFTNVLPKERSNGLLYKDELFSESSVSVA